MLIIWRVLIVLATVFPLSGYGCEYTVIGAPYNVNYGNIIVQRDVPVGEAISNEIYGSLALAYSCTPTGNEGSTAGMKSAGLAYAFTTASGRRVYQTGLPGVGISVGYYEKTTAGDASFNGTTWLGADLFTASWSSNSNEIHASQFQPIIQFWKTGTITSGSVNGLLASFVAWTEQYRGGTTAPDIPVYAGTGSITQVACAITTPNLVFLLGDVPLSRFGNTVGTLPDGAQSTLNLGLNCDSGANINVTLSGIPYPESGNSSVLALSGQGAEGVADGVGVQLLYNGVPLVLNSTVALKQANGGQESLPITARYYQTKTSVSTGTANASATLILTYQ
ncbi:fimbrial protein [Leclercia adecarboxylata]|uniref:fimbrial protein n=1 Tax=Leclercia adecarboxylata TaxID=83655 RepID=UPI002DB82F2F|nr:fimbrial protein [Leclercia adecarboxylata]MEB6377367.1 fimbrial protein [Leclercia adecarboxylata]